MARRYGCKEVVLPSAAMIAVEFSSAVLNVSLKGMKESAIPPLKFPLFSRVCLLAVLGFSGQLFVYKGLEFGSPTLASAISNLIPAFTFILAVFFRMEKVAFGSSTTRAKIIGTTTSICGALLIVFYKGPKVIPSPPWTSSSSLLSTLLQSPLVLSSQSNWIIGGLLVSVAYLLFFIRSQIMKIYPEEITVNFFYFLFGTIISLPVCLLAEPNLSSWRLGSNIAVVAVLYSGVFGFSIFSLVQIWGVRTKGPVFVACFRRTSIVIVVAMSAIFLGEAVYLGSVIGTLILSTGLYCVLWGKAKEEEEEEEEEGMMDDDGSGLSTSGPLSNRSTPTIPLLQSRHV